jgi:hypothetical protein
MPTKPRGEGISPRLRKAKATRNKRLTFHRAVTMEISESLSAFARLSVAAVWATPKSTT